MIMISEFRYEVSMVFCRKLFNFISMLFSKTNLLTESNPSEVHSVLSTAAPYRESLGVQISLRISYAQQIFKICNQQRKSEEHSFKIQMLIYISIKLQPETCNRSSLRRTYLYSFFI